MRELLLRQPLAAALAALAVALLVAIGLETGFGARMGPRIPAGFSKRAAPPEAKLMPPLAAAEPDRAYAEMVARPLFVPMRRPAPAPEQAAVSALKRGQFVLQGVTIAGETRIALLREKTTGRVHRVEKGHEVNGMKLAEVTPESVTLAQGAEQEVLPLQVQRASAAGPGAQLGPFGPASAPGFPTAPPAGIRPQVPGATAPATAQPPIVSHGPMPDFGPAPPNPAARPVPQATTAPLSPEELLARRRARRTQQTQ